MKKRDRYFQWIDGDDAGKVCKLVDVTNIDGEIFYEFDSGDVCNKMFVAPSTTNKPASLKNMFMVEVESPDSKNIWRFKTIEECVGEIGDGDKIVIPPIDDIMGINGDGPMNGIKQIDDSNVGKRKIMPPTLQCTNAEIMTLPDENWFGNKKEQPVEQPAVVQDKPVEAKKEIVEEARPVEQPIQTVEQPIQTVEQNAVAIIVNKSKKHSTPIRLSINIDLPSKSVYNLIRDEYEDGSELFIEEVIKSLTYEKITEAVKNGLRDAYNDTEKENGE